MYTYIIQVAKDISQGFVIPNSHQPKIDPCETPF